ncbi:anaerobic ribonucleoside-triphosphate reductase activating protein [Neobacillus sp. LXY-4]|uniref:anaerobic ribonucleoside-triphosphate reductase activating protein n=1 Tax=Neobacillus sp. LXY-4 TaxID=3379826 RepID=UPI003EE30F02
MKVINIIHDSIVDGEGFRSVVFFAGCSHHCLGCHNPQSWKMENGTDMTKEQIYTEIMNNELTNVTFSGGDPFLQSHDVSELAKALKQAGKNIWCYTGYTFEELLVNRSHISLLGTIDVLVDGRFELEKRDLSLLYKGSSNQRIIDVAKSLQLGETVIYKN